jgi:broad specificity phosphatase PhoE
MSFILLWRHAPTASNLGGVVQGTLDVGLDDFGIARARWAADEIVAAHAEPVTLRGEPVTPREVAGSPLRVFSSPLRRAVQTAQALTEVIGGDIVVDDAFRQRSYGSWEGLTWEQIEREWPEEFARREEGLDPRIPGWDGQEAVARRVLEGLERIWDPERPAVVVSHGSPIALGLLAAIGEPASSIALGRVPHAAWAVVRRVDSGAWHIEQFAVGAD